MAKVEPQTEALSRPELTLPEAEAAVLRAEYARAKVILEYGSGGSTLIAGEQAGTTIFSVESDAKWCAKMQAWFAANPAAGRVHLHYADIGPTVSWGRPKDQSGMANWPGYALSVWDRPDFEAPDLVLVDGRFRPACFMTAVLKTKKPITILFDDYLPRTEYHVVEEFFRPVSKAGRMARFEVTPMALPPERLSWLVDLYLKPY